MPLSEREQQLLEQMEQALYAEDPQFATALRETRQRALDGRRLALGVLVVLAGLGGLIAGVALSFVPLGVIGFLAMLGGVLLGAKALISVPEVVQGGPASSTTPKAKREAGSTFMGKMEGRWRQRRDGEHA
ncbi:MAG: DUF3040 domain-containing protein [Candidatus Nanopelagicales bacterium]|nr:DUF3040 domain-containing protein [Candidatus Nanopelagicales bacterium]